MSRSFRFDAMKYKTNTREGEVDKGMMSEQHDEVPSRYSVRKKLCDDVSKLDSYTTL